MDDERGDGTQTVEMTVVERAVWNEVDAVKEEAGSRDTVEKSIGPVSK